MTPLPAGLFWLPRLALLCFTGIGLGIGIAVCRGLWHAWTGITIRRSDRAEQTLRAASLANILAAEVLAQITTQRVTVDDETGIVMVTCRHPEEGAEIVATSAVFRP